MIQAVLRRLGGAPLRLGALPGTRHFQIRVPGGYAPCNPSIAADGDGFLLLVRSVNYEIYVNGSYVVPGGGDFDTVNWLVSLDRDFGVRDVRQIDDRRMRSGPPQIGCGLEDARLFRWRGAWWFVASAKFRTWPLWYTMTLCRLEGAEVAEWSFAPSPQVQSVEKNWMPRVSGDDLNLVYWISPMQVFDVPEGGRFVLRDTGARAPGLEGWSGSSQLVRYGNNWLCVIHRHDGPFKKLDYRHIFVELDDEFRVLRFSRPWVFGVKAVEFCAGLCLTGRDAVLSYGRMDREARLLTVPIETVELLLQRDARAEWKLRGQTALARLTRASPRGAEIIDAAAPRAAGTR